MLPVSQYPDAAARTAFVDRLLSSVRALPGASAAGISDAVPMANRQGTSFTLVDAPVAESSTAIIANFAYITGGYFEALGMRLSGAGPSPDAQPAPAQVLS